MKEVDEITRRVYFISDEEIANLSTLKLAQKFSQYYKIPMHLFKDVTKLKPPPPSSHHHHHHTMNTHQTITPNTTTTTSRLTLGPASPTRGR